MVFTQGVIWLRLAFRGDLGEIPRVCRTTGKDRSPSEKAEFNTMLANVNFLYLGCQVLILLDNGAWPPPPQTASTQRQQPPHAGTAITPRSVRPLNDIEHRLHSARPRPHPDPTWIPLGSHLPPRSHLDPPWIPLATQIPLESLVSPTSPPPDPPCIPIQIRARSQRDPMAGSPSLRRVPPPFLDDV